MVCLPPPAPHPLLLLLRSSIHTLAHAHKPKQSRSDETLQNSSIHPSVVLFERTGFLPVCGDPSRQLILIKHRKSIWWRGWEGGSHRWLVCCSCPAVLYTTAVLCCQCAQSWGERIRQYEVINYDMTYIFFITSRVFPFSISACIRTLWAMLYHLKQVYETIDLLVYNITVYWIATSVWWYVMPHSCQ